MKRKLFKAAALSMGAAMSMGVLAGFGGCGQKARSLVLMTDPLNEIFSPFYSTAASDMDVAGQTQLGMFTTDYNGDIAVGEDEACVALDWEEREVGSGDNKKTEFYFVIKNDIKFSDGVPLTMNDVLFSMYINLDPAFTGSSTMYSTDIEGLKAYRTQQNQSGDSSGDESINQAALLLGNQRLTNLINAFKKIGEIPGSTTSWSADETKMREGLLTYTPDDGYMRATGCADLDAAHQQLVEDYNNVVEKFDAELRSDYDGSIDAYIEEPYNTVSVRDGSGKEVRKGFDDVISFMYREGMVEVQYARDPVTNEYDTSKMEYVTLQYSTDIDTRDEAIEAVRRATLPSKFDQILLYWATGSQVLTEFTSKATDILLHENLPNGELVYKSVSGIKSLGHMDDAPATCPVNNKEYKVATEHNEDGTPVNSDEYDILRITINGIDPKAKWNFGFTVAPYHYYSDPDCSSKAAQEYNAKARAKGDPEWDLSMDIKNEKFGVAWASFDFQTKIIQGVNSWGASKNKIPLGAGPYVATDRNDSDQPEGNDFVSGNTVWYKANENFVLGAPKIKHMQYSVVTSANAISKLQGGEVHFVTPQYDQANGAIVNDPKFERQGFKALSTWQLGYGYIGINAGFVKNIYLRRAIMAAMDTSLALEYYTPGTCVNIAWPMSIVSWAYPRVNGAEYDGSNPMKNMDGQNAHDYAMPVGGDKTTGDEQNKRKELIKSYMSKAQVQAGDPSLEIKFTIAGSSLTEHPCYAVFLKAVDLLNDCGWKVEVQADTNALTKLSTGSLAVWAAAWGSSLDPDMYQIYHKNSTATSVSAWGYKQILASPSEYPEETKLLNELAVLIDEGRQSNDRATRTATYKKAMSKVLDLAVELPVYQRQSLYALNLNVIKEESLEHDPNNPKELLNNPYSSPLAKIWNVELN